jgi:hypothetical protein
MNLCCVTDVVDATDTHRSGSLSTWTMNREGTSNDGFVCLSANGVAPIIAV